MAATLVARRGNVQPTPPATTTEGERGPIFAVEPGTDLLFLGARLGPEALAQFFRERLLSDGLARLLN